MAWWWLFTGPKLVAKWKRVYSQACWVWLANYWNIHLATAVTVRTARLTFNNSTFCPRSVFMCFVWISEQTAIISLYSINWLLFITETVCVYCAVRTGSLNIRSAHKVYLCGLCGSEKKQPLFPYTALTDWFLYTDGVCFLRGTSWIFKYTFRPHSVFMCFVCISEQTAIISQYNINWLVFIPETECLLRGTNWIFKYAFCPHSVFMCFVWVSEQTAIISQYSINWLVLITETECVYCAVRTGSLNMRSAHTVYLCVLCGSRNKQWFFPIQH
jgi:ribosomal protein S26